VEGHCFVNGAQVSQNDTVSEQSSVSAGGTDVNQGGTGPQDPNTGDPTSTYGRYAQLPFNRSVPIGDGNTLRCDLAGERTDPSTPVRGRRDDHFYDRMRDPQPDLASERSTNRDRSCAGDVVDRMGRDERPSALASCTSRTTSESR
jgi:hypothetical protein